VVEIKTDFPRTRGLVSIVVTNHNKAGYLYDCLNGLLTQTYRKWELILIDDSSADDSLGEARLWQAAIGDRLSESNEVTLLSLPRNTGYAGALTTGMYLAKGEYIAIQDSDDVSHPERLDRQVAYLREHPEIELLGTNYAVFEDEISGRLKSAGWIRYGEDISRVYADGGHCVCQGTIMLRGVLFDRKGGFTRKVTGAEDYEFIVNCFVRNPRNVENLKDILYYSRNQSISLI
jgi:glycosyltransferase involved in cell wall biosynthesis